METYLHNQLTSPPPASFPYTKRPWARCQEYRREDERAAAPRKPPAPKERRVSIWTKAVQDRGYWGGRTDVHLTGQHLEKGGTWDEC